MAIVALYLRSGLGAKERNQRILISLGAFLKGMADPRAAIGDCNMAPSSLERSGWPAQLRGELLVPTDALVTCDKAEAGSLAEYALAKAGPGQCYLLRGYTAVTWETHIGLQLDLAGRSASWWQRKIIAPAASPKLERLKKAPDPASKRSLQRAAALERRR